MGKSAFTKAYSRRQRQDRKKAEKAAAKKAALLASAADTNVTPSTSRKKALPSSSRKRPPTPKKNPRGRPKKRIKSASNTAAAAVPARRSTRSSGSTASAPPPSRPASSRKSSSSTPRRITRSAATVNAPKPKRSDEAKRRDFYVAEPAKPTFPGPKFHIGERFKYYKSQIAMHSVGKKCFRNMWLESISTFEEHENCSNNPDTQAPLPMSPPTPIVEAPAITKMKSLLRKFIDKNPEHPIVSTLHSIARRDATGTSSRNKEVSLTHLKDAFKTIVSHYLHHFNDDDKADAIANLLFNESIFDKNSTQKVAHQITRGITTQKFNAVALLRLLDLHTGALNDTGVDLYASLGNPSKGQGFLPKRWRMRVPRNAANKLVLESFKVRHNPCTEFGETIRVDFERQLRFVIKAFGLHQKAVNEGIEIAITGDGAAITTSTTTAGQTALGWKLVDPDTIDPNTGEKLFLSVDSDGNTLDSYERMQSSDNCVVAAIVLAKETKKLLRVHFADFFKFANDIAKHGLPATDGEPALKPFKIIGSADMSFQQKLVGMGGACKSTTFFCHCCECDCKTDYNFFHCVYGDERCRICMHNDSISCCHRAVNDAEEIQRKTEWLTDVLMKDYSQRHDGQFTLVDMIPDEEVDCFDGYDDDGNEKNIKINLRNTIDDHGNCSRPIYDYLQHVKHSEELLTGRVLIRYDPCSLTRDTDPSNIDYVVSVQSQNNSRFKANVKQELNKRNMREVPADERVGTLRSRLMLQYKLKRHRDALLLHRKSNTIRVMDPGQIPPCVLHFHMRTMEKIVTMLLVLGLNACKTAQERAEFVKRVSHGTNRYVFEKEMHDEDTSGWKVPMTPDGKDLGDVGFDDTQAKAFEKNFETFVDLCLDGCTVNDANNTLQSLKDDWKEMIVHYRGVNAWVKSRSIFKWEDVCQFQLEADEFMKLYIALTGRPGMTNYFHMLHAGHFAYYLIEYHNLYRLSQQGWENVNSLMKRSFHRCTQRGGSGLNRIKSKLMPIFYRVQRMFMWTAGYLESYFESLGFDDKEDFVYGKTFKLPKFEQTSIEQVREFGRKIVNFTSIEELSELGVSIEDYGSDDEMFGQ